MAKRNLLIGPEFQYNITCVHNAQQTPFIYIYKYCIFSGGEDFHACSIPGTCISLVLREDSLYPYKVLNLD